MAVQRIGLAPQAISMSVAGADALISAGNGDAALLFLYLLRREGLYDPAQAAKALGWDGNRLTPALSALRQMGLAAWDQPEAEPPAPRPERCPEYSTADVTSELETPGSQFPGLLGEVERQLGRTLSSADVKMLLEIVDYVAMPPEVILLLVRYCVQEIQRRQGQGRRPRMSQIRATAYRWREQGIDSAEAVTAYLKKLEYYHSQEGQVLSVLGFRGREAVAGEQKYIHSWLDMGFGLDAIALAHERTVLKTGGMNWPYCNSILKRWNQKNLHTPEEIAAGDGAGNKSVPGTQPVREPEQVSRRDQQDVEWMRKFLERE